MLLCVQHEICGVLHAIQQGIKAHCVWQRPPALLFSCKVRFSLFLPSASPAVATLMPFREKLCGQLGSYG